MTFTYAVFAKDINDMHPFQFGYGGNDRKRKR